MATRKGNGKISVQRSSIYFSEPDKIIVMKVAGKINIPGLNNSAVLDNAKGNCTSTCATCPGSCISRCDCACACDCQCVCECDDNHNTDCSFVGLPPEAAEKIIEELKLKDNKKLTSLDDRYGQIVSILNRLQETKPAKIDLTNNKKTTK